MRSQLRLIAIALLFSSLYACTGYEVPQDPSMVTPLSTGESIPNVTLQDAFGHSESLRELASEGPVLLIFYRGGWCPYCSEHLADLKAIDDQLYNQGIKIVGISPDQPAYLKESIADQELNYSLLSDSQMDAAKAFGLAFKVDSETLERYRNHGLDLTERSGQDHGMLPVPAAYLVDGKGLIRFSYTNPDYTVRVDTLKLLEEAGRL